MSEHALAEELVKEILAYEPNDGDADSFDILRDVISLYNRIGFTRDFYIVFFTLLEKSYKFEKYRNVVNSLVRDIGLFPYIEESEVDSFKELVALNTFLTPSIKNKKTLFHFPQAKVFYTIMSGQSVILSAPTSFGKSLIIDTIISTRQFSNIVIIVPTIALIDETRKRLNTFSDYYKIITHPTQSRQKNNIYVLTQERAILNNFIEDVDFFIIDEFYKLSPQDKNVEDIRCDVLNIAFYKLCKKCKHFYMLGPNIEGLAQQIDGSISYVFFKEQFPTVGAVLYKMQGEPSADKLFDIYSSSGEQTLIYCNGPKATTELANQLAEIKPKKVSDSLVSALCNWISETYHEEWSLIGCLQHGIGVHHARLPRALAQIIIELFNNKRIDILLCTSTIIEGVNTSAKNVIMHEQKIGANDLDFFTFNNVAGRAGRMFKHFIGNVFIFSDPPQECLPFVDIPILSQNKETSVNILLGMDLEDLSSNSYKKVAKYYENKGMPLSIETLKKSPHVNPEKQIALADRILVNKYNWHSLLSWSSNPTYDQLAFICDIMFKFFDAQNLAGKSVKSAKQLHFLIDRLRNKYTTKEIIEAEVEKNKGTFYERSIDTYITNHLNFVRLWATHHFPRLLTCISFIQEEVYNSIKLKPGDYSYYALSVESLFFDPALVCLEEYGIPLELSRKIEPIIAINGNLDLTLDALRRIDIKSIPLTNPEKMFMKRALEFI